jgi:hypothetical protein
MALAPHFVHFSEGAQFVEWRASSSVPGCAALIRMAAVGYPTSSVAPLRPVTVARCRTVRDLPPPSRTVAAPNSFPTPRLASCALSPSFNALRGLAEPNWADTRKTKTQLAIRDIWIGS